MVPAPLSTMVTLWFRRKAPRIFQAVRLHIRDIGLEKARHLAGMRRHDDRPLCCFQDIYMLRDDIYAIRIDHQGAFRRRQQLGHQRHRSSGFPQPTAN